MSLSNIKVHELEQQIQWPCELSSEFKRAFLQYGVLQTHQQGYEFKNTEDTKEGMFYLLNGSLIISMRTKDFDHFTYHLIGQNEFLYYGDLMGYRLQESISVEFLQDSQYLKIPEQQMQVLKEQQPEFYKFMFEHLKKKSLPLIQRGFFNSKFSIDLKVAFTLLDLINKQRGIKGAVSYLSITQQQLADLSDVTRQRVNAVLKKFEKQGILAIERGKIFLHDKAKLKQLLENENLTFNSFD
ncbi:Crp/Fnr family transcriptional regulator [Thalassotalea crassostreae]|uniref:Crp/Fnr family transcriptional regulator n=1 Tax=Thalassotalea crassostreae TaxID=1763536 RepID=UPI00083904BF|nr:Crp/Fnr family transcriptional regulator [Thalassotalea crassostreae]